MPSTSGIGSTSYTITGLTPGAQYDVRVRVDSPALGPWSDNVRGTVPTAADDTLTADFTSITQTTSPDYLGVCSSLYGAKPDPAGTAAQQAQAAAEQALDARYWRVPVQWSGTYIQSGAAYADQNVEDIIQLYYSWGHRMILVISGRTTTDDWNGYQSGDAAAILDRLTTLGLDLARFDISGPNEPNNQVDAGTTVAVTTQQVIDRNIAIYDEIQTALPGRKVWGPVWSWYARAAIDTYRTGMGATRHAGVDYHNYAMGNVADVKTTATAFAETGQWGTQVDELEADATAEGADTLVNLDEINLSWQFQDGTPDAEGGVYRTIDYGGGNTRSEWCNDRFFTAINTVWHASVIGHVLRAGGRVMPYATQNGALGLTVETGNPTDFSGQPQSSPMPSFWGVAAWTGAGAPGQTRAFSHYNDTFYATTTSDALTECFAVNNEAGGRNVVLVNKRESVARTVAFTPTGIANGTTYHLFQTDPAAPYTAPTKTGPFTYNGGAISVSMAACSVTTIVFG